VTEDRIRIVNVRRGPRPSQFKLVCPCGSEDIQARRSESGAFSTERDVYHVDIRCSECERTEVARKLGGRSAYVNLGVWEDEDEN